MRYFSRPRSAMQGMGRQRGFFQDSRRGPGLGARGVFGEKGICRRTGEPFNRRLAGGVMAQDRQRPASSTLQMLKKRASRMSQALKDIEQQIWSYEQQ